MKDAGNVILEQVRDTVERHSSVKMNTAFNGEFVAGDKWTNKSIAIRTTNMYE